MTMGLPDVIPDHDGPRVDETPEHSPARARKRRLLPGLQLVTGACAPAGGALLMVAPDGSLLKTDPSVLEGSPFTDWRVPGILLTVLVGGGVLDAAIVGLAALEARP